MKIVEVPPLPNWVLSIVADDGRIGSFDVRPYLEYQAFEDLRDTSEFMPGELMKVRIEYLDGLRGVAILWVIAFHAYARWPELVPYGDQYKDFPLFKYGWAGVELFFLISGFVILMTLEKCDTMAEFIYRRWLRLFPAMFICSLIIFFSSGYFFERPAGVPTLTSLLPGLTFIDPDWWSLMAKQPIQPLEGAFWSLYLEFKFYIIAAFCYYWRGWKFLLVFLVVGYGVGVALIVGTDKGQLDLYLPLVTYFDFSLIYFGWFASGAAFYIYSKSNNKKWLIFAVSVALASSLISGFLWEDGFGDGFLAVSLASALFTVPIIYPSTQALLRNRVLQFFGLISYPLYLLHENMMIAMVIKMNKASPDLPPALFVPITVALISSLAWLVQKYGEPKLKRLFVNPSRFRSVKHQGRRAG